MRGDTMREVDGVRVADVIGRAMGNIDEQHAVPQLAYVSDPDSIPAFSYRHYNIRSRHFRLDEVFFVAHDGEYRSISLLRSCFSFVGIMDKFPLFIARPSR